MAPIAVITRETTTAPKVAGFGCTTLHAEGSTWDGDPELHEIAWGLEAYPEGFIFQCFDPRPGRPSDTVINARDGGWRGVVYKVPNDLPGTYRAWCRIKAPDGTYHRVTHEWTIAEAEGVTEIYVDGEAAGAGDGSSWADAYTDLTVALGAAASAGPLVRVRLRGGQTHACSSRVNFPETAANYAVVWDGTGGTPPTVDVGAVGMAQFAGENITLDGRIVFESTADVGQSEQANPFLIHTETCRDLLIRDVEVGEGGNRLQSFIEQTFPTPPRVLLVNVNAGDRMRNYGVFGSLDLCVLGGYFGHVQSERPFRLVWGRSAMAGVRVVADFKDCVRYMRGLRHDLYRTFVLLKDGVQATSGINLGMDGGRPEIVRIDSCHIRSEAATTVGHGLYTNYGAGETETGLAVVGCVVELTETTVTGTCLYITGVNLNRAHVLGCTLIGRSKTSNSNCVQVSAEEVVNAQGNILIYAGDQVESEINDKMAAFSTPAPGGVLTVRNNAFDRGVMESAHLVRVNGDRKTMEAFNDIDGVGGNIEATVVLDEDYIPAEPIDLPTSPDGLFADYYGNPVTPGEASKMGAVVAPPPGPELAVAIDGNPVGDEVVNKGAAEAGESLTALLEITNVSADTRAVTVTPSEGLTLDQAVDGLELDPDETVTRLVTLDTAGEHGAHEAPLTIDHDGEGAPTVVVFAWTVNEPEPPEPVEPRSGNNRVFLTTPFPRARIL